tara:strand:+ start:122 stop:643 length:522 start_codon:yes stop_codon:yes gene_type:complete
MSFGGWPLYPKDPEGGYDGSNPNTSCSVCGIRTTMHTRVPEALPEQQERFSGLIPYLGAQEMGLFSWEKIRKNAAAKGFKDVNKVVEVCENCRNKAIQMKKYAEGKVRMTRGRKKGGRASGAISRKKAIARKKQGSSDKELWDAYEKRQSQNYFDVNQTAAEKAAARKAKHSR